MRIECKPDWHDAQERIEAWWEGGILDRPVVQVVAPRRGLTWDRLASSRPADEVSPAQILEWFTDPDQVIPRLEQAIYGTYWGGEALPVMFPVSIGLVAIVAAYLGCPYEVTSGTGWAAPIIRDWNQRPAFVFDPANEWWLRSKRLLEAAAQQASGQYYVGVPDLNGPGQILALLRDSQQLAIDLIDSPGPVGAALNEINIVWLRYWQACVGAIHQWTGDYLFWMGIWSSQPAIDLQNDFSCLISSEMFEEFFIPGLEQQTKWVERTVYHLDGPGAVRHLDLLLSLPHLDGIQWVPGAGAPPASKWIRLLRRIQAGGKLLVLTCEPYEVETLLSELEPEGLLLTTRCESEEQAESLLAQVPTWVRRRQWVVA